MTFGSFNDGTPSCNQSLQTWLNAWEEGKSGKHHVPEKNVRVGHAFTTLAVTFKSRSQL